MHSSLRRVIKAAGDANERPAFRTFRYRDVNRLSRRKKERQIHAPNRAMRDVHTTFMRYLRGIIRRHGLPYATGALRKSSPRRNVVRHRHNRFFYLTDLRDAYQKVDMFKLADVLCNLTPEWQGDTMRLWQILDTYCMAPEGGLRTGGPASPDLFNLYCGILLDRPLGELAAQYGITYSRYLDDLTFSALQEITPEIRREIRKIIAEAGFEVNHGKSFVLDLGKGPIEINGVGLEYEGRIFMPARARRKLYGMLHCAVRGENISPAKIFGHMGLFRSIVCEGRGMSLYGRTKSEQKLIRLYWIWLGLYRSWID